MISSFFDAIEKLYEVTLTPRSTDYFKKPGELKEKVTFVKAGFLTHAPEITEEKVKEGILFFLRLPATPENCRGILLIEPCLRYLVVNAFKEAEIAQNMSDEIISIAEAWFLSVKKLSNKERIYSQKPDIQDSPIFRFHLDSLRLARAGNEPMPSLYQAYGYFFHKQLRINRRYEIEDKTHEDYARTARYFFEYMPPEIKARTDHPEKIPREYVSLFVDQFKSKPPKKHGGNISELVEAYKFRLSRLIAGVPLQAKPHGEARRVFLTDPPDGVVEILEKDGRLPGIHRYVITEEVIDKEPDMDEEEIESEIFEAEHEFDVYDIPEEEHTVPKKPSLSRGWQDLINLRSFIFYFDSNCLNLFHYAILHLKLMENWYKSSFENAIILYLLILSHTGIDRARLLNLVFFQSQAGEDAIFLENINGRYFIVQKSIINFKRKIDHPACLKHSTEIHIPFPDMINAMIGPMRGYGPFVFSGVSERGDVRQISLEDVEKYLNKKINRAFPEFELKISADKIERSFFNLYQDRFGLDPHICVLISGQDPYRLYQTQLHYIHIEHERLSLEYLDAFHRVNQQIKENLDELKKRGFLGIEKGKGKKNRPQAIPKIFTNEEENQGNDSATYDEGFGYGSPIICSKEYVAGLVGRLKEAIRAEKNVIKRHNLYVVYTYLCLQFSACLRPRSNPQILRQHYNEASGMIVISDKQSKKYFEERFIPLPKVLKRLFENLTRDFESLILYLAKYHSPSIIGAKEDRIFFLLNESNGGIIDFKLKEMRRILMDIGIDYSLPPNWPRHFSRNNFYRIGIANDLAEYWMGHQHCAKEVLNVASSVFLDILINTGLPVIEKLLEELGFEVMDYMPARIL